MKIKRWIWLVFMVKNSTYAPFSTSGYSWLYLFVLLLQSFTTALFTVIHGWHSMCIFGRSQVSVICAGVGTQSYGLLRHSGMLTVCCTSLAHWQALKVPCDWWQSLDLRAPSGPILIPLPMPPQPLFRDQIGLMSVSGAPLIKNTSN